MVLPGSRAVCAERGQEGLAGLSAAGAGCEPSLGAVWLANDELLDRDVAVKEIFWPTELDEKERGKLRQRALREARTAARINHPNIIGVYDVVEEGERPWIVMQLARDPSPREGGGE